MQNNMLNNKLIVFDFIHFESLFKNYFKIIKQKQKLIYLVILFTVIKIQQLYITNILLLISLFKIFLLWFNIIFHFNKDKIVLNNFNLN
jgi:hypothetical protein